jgi:hypothetical protein
MALLDKMLQMSVHIRLLFIVSFKITFINVSLLVLIIFLFTCTGYLPAGVRLSRRQRLAGGQLFMGEIVHRRVFDVPHIYAQLVAGL